MNVDKKKTHTIFVVGLIILVCTLLIFGVSALVKVDNEGSRQVLSSMEQQSSDIYDSVQQAPLTDEQFMYGLTNIIPQLTNTSTELLVAKTRLQTSLEEFTDSFCSCETINYFGNPACIVTISIDVPLDVLCSIFLQHSFYTRIYIDQIDPQGAVVAEAIWHNDTLSLVESSPVNITVLNTLIAEVSSEYSAASFTIGDRGLIIYADALSNEDVLDLFDYCHQWLMLNHQNILLQVLKQECIVASTVVLPTDSKYHDYYPREELAPYFRMSYYYNTNCFKGNLRRTCQLYINTLS